MGAAFFGPLVEKHIKLAALISALLLCIGLSLSGLAIHFKSVLLFYVGMGVFCGISEGCGYVVPVKNLLLWWNKTKKKGLISAISIISFGLGSTICSWLFKVLHPSYGIEHTFYALAIIYAFSMAIGCIMIDKPKYAKALIKKSGQIKSFIDYAKDSFFRKAWLFMFLNISMGLILIGSCATILKEVNLSSDMIIVVMMLCGIFNGGGRLVFPLISDFLKHRINIWILILILEIAVMTIPMFVYAVIPFSIILINATYGSAFATLPSVLADKYGTKELSAVHGYCLSAWGIASLFAYVCTTFALSLCGNYYFLVFILAFIYLINLVNVFSLKWK